MRRLGAIALIALASGCSAPSIDNANAMDEAERDAQEIEKKADALVRTEIEKIETRTSAKSAIIEANPSDEADPESKTP